MGNRLLVVGSVALDSIKTPKVNKPKLLGGAACYASVAASHYVTPAISAVVGTDFPKKYIELLKSHKVNLQDMQIAEGKTFYWSGEYEENMNNRQTKDLQLGVYADFKPNLTEVNRRAKFVMLGVIMPTLQMDVLNQLEAPEFVLADTIDCYIKEVPQDLKRLLKRVDLICLNDSEARLLTKTDNLLDAAKKIHKMGPETVIIKKGEYGAMLSDAEGIFLAPAFPLQKAVDPTGAGDSFAGALMGYIAAHANTKVEAQQIMRQAIMNGSVVASFCCEGFGLQRLDTVTKEDIKSRLSELKSMIAVDI